MIIYKTSDTTLLRLSQSYVSFFLYLFTLSVKVPFFSYSDLIIPKKKKSICCFFFHCYVRCGCLYALSWLILSVASPTSLISLLPSFYPLLFSTVKGLFVFFTTISAPLCTLYTMLSYAFSNFLFPFSPSLSSVPSFLLQWTYLSTTVLLSQLI